jgi:16S rRNA (uracil1498-N3)-methyltransferase
MARLFVAPERLGGETVALDDEPHRYLSRVLRLQAGDAVTVFDGEGHEIAAVIESSDARVTVLRLGERRDAARLGRPVILLQAIPKGERMDLLVQKTTELGVARICPVVSARTVVQAVRAKPGAAGGSGDNRLRRWRLIAQEAARQCGRADLPIVDEPRSLDEALALTPPDCVRFMAWEEDRAQPLRRALGGDEPAVALLIGAEGGFTAAEAETAARAGFTAVGLGPRILRSETAAIVAVALVQAALGSLD